MAIKHAVMFVAGILAGGLVLASAEPVQGQQVDRDLLDAALHLLGRFVDKFGDVLTHPNVLWSVFSVIAGAVLGVVVMEALKRFAPLMPRIFEGEHWKLKVMATAALVGGVIGCALTAVTTQGTGAAVTVYALVGFIAAAAGTPSLYELAYKLAPGFTDRLLKRVRGEA